MKALVAAMVIGLLTGCYEATVPTARLLNGGTIAYDEGAEERAAAIAQDFCNGPFDVTRRRTFRLDSQGDVRPLPITLMAFRCDDGPPIGHVALKR